MFRRSEGIQSSQGFMERTLIDACSAGSYIKACGHFGMMHIATHTCTRAHRQANTRSHHVFKALDLDQRSTCFVTAYIHADFHFCSNRS